MPRLCKKRETENYKELVQASQYAVRKKSLVVMIAYLTVAENMNAIMIFKSSETMQVPAFQSEERWNDRSCLEDESKETRLYVLSGKQWNNNVTFDSSM